MTAIPNPIVPALRASLLGWGTGRRSHLPWRGETDPYRIWVSEIMLQQTRTETATPYYRRFLERFPTVHALAAAPLDDVLRLWEGLGYYSRARTLHAAARLVMERHSGLLPHAPAELRALPGIGDYTAGAIASLAFGLAEPALDGNGRRVLIRLTAMEGDPASPPIQRQLWDLARRLLPPDQPGAFNVALMDLGATVCTPRRPDCPACPWAPHCQALAQGKQEALPHKAPSPDLPHYDMVAGLICQDGLVLVAQRPAPGLLGGLWALPGGRRQQDETLRDGLVRVVREGLAVEIETGEPFAAVQHAYTHFRITLHGFRCRYLSGEPEPLAYTACRWATPQDLALLGFSVTDRRLLRLALASPAV